MFHLINTAYAESAATGATGGGLSSSLLMIIVMVVVFYFLLIRPENKRKKEAESMRSSLKKGDYIAIGEIEDEVSSSTDIITRYNAFEIVKVVDNLSASPYSAHIKLVVK